LHSAQPAQAQVDASNRMQVLRLERCDALKVHGAFPGSDAHAFSRRSIFSITSEGIER